MLDNICIELYVCIWLVCLRYNWYTKRAWKGELHVKPQIGKRDQETELPGRNHLGVDPHWNAVLSKKRGKKKKRNNKIYIDV